MTEKEIWGILGIDPCEDEKLIKKAYLKKMQSGINPEEDQQGFIRLRGAYEEAVRCIQKKNEQVLTKDEDEKDPVDCWMKNVQHIYTEAALRVQEQVWQQLLHEEVCVSLDTSDLCRKELLAYLMQHAKLPTAIWKIIVENFQMKEDQKILEERFPADFIRYILHNSENENYLFIEGLEQKDEEDADQMMTDYYKLRNAVDQLEEEYKTADAIAEKEEKHAQLLREIKECQQTIKQYASYHPYLTVEELRIAMYTGNEMQAKIYFQTLSESKWKDNFYISNILGRYLIHIKEFHQAEELIRALLERIPEYYSVQMMLVRCLIYKAEEDAINGKEVVSFCHDIDYDDTYLPIREAEEILFELFDRNSQDPELKLLLNEICRFKLKIYEERLLHYPSEMDSLFEKAWCYYRMEQYEEAKQILLSLPEEAEEEYTYPNLLSRTYLALQQYDKALPLLVRWIAMIENTDINGGRNARHRHEVLDYAYYSLGGVYCEKQIYDEAKNAYERCLNVTMQHKKRFQIPAMDRIAVCQYRQKDYEDAMDTCEKILAMDAGYFPAIVRHQKIAYWLHKDQIVIDDCMAAKKVYTGYFAIYSYTARVFLRHGMIEDAGCVLEDAKNAGHEQCEVYRLLNLRQKRLSIVEDAAENTKEQISEQRKLLIKEAKQLTADVNHRKKEEEKQYALTGKKPEKDIPGEEHIDGTLTREEEYEIGEELFRHYRKEG